MSVVVFVGPTLTREEVSGEIEALCLPPVSQGDLYRCLRLDPRAIAIVDGAFESVPAVWHKEILWALSQGVHVFGAASMGALRAAELASFGMVGVGGIFHDFLEGRLQDDDEVALVHAPRELGYRQISEAMVNIRATLEAATSVGLLEEAEREALVGVAKALHYSDRSYELVFERARGRELPEPTVRTLEAWLPKGRIDRKKRDALELLAALRDHLARDPGPHAPSFTFEPTRSWIRMIESLDAKKEGPVLEYLRRLLRSARSEEPGAS